MTAPTAPEITCSTCLTGKDPGEFPWRDKKAGRRRGVCKACILVQRQKTSPVYTERTPRADRDRPTEPDGHKFCTGCRTIRPHAEFWRDSRGRHGLASRCKPCERPSVRAKMRRLRESDPERYVLVARAGRLLRRYGVTLEWFLARIEAQGGQCPTCTVEYTPIGERGPAEPVLDHCHARNVVRDVICRLCNMALGSARDDPATLRRLADHAERSGSTSPLGA